MIATVPALTPISPHRRDYLSYSAVKTYQDCPLKYYFRYVAGLPEATVAASLVFGSAIHRGIEHHFRALLAGNRPPTLNMMLEQYRQGWQTRDNTPIQFGADEDQASFEPLAGKMLAAFQQSDMARPAGEILAIEEEVRGEVIPGLPEILARLDLVIESPEALIIADWKTSRSRWTTAQVDDAAGQLLLYSELVREFAPGKPRQIEFAVFTKTKEVHVERHTRDVQPRQVDRTKRVVERVWQAIQAEHFYPAPSPMSCPSCPYCEPCQGWSG